MSCRDQARERRAIFDGGQVIVPSRRQVDRNPIRVDLRCDDTAIDSVAVETEITRIHAGTALLRGDPGGSPAAGFRTCRIHRPADVGAVVQSSGNRRVGEERVGTPRRAERGLERDDAPPRSSGRAVAQSRRAAARNAGSDRDPSLRRTSRAAGTRAIRASPSAHGSSDRRRPLIKNFV
ncbi:hypothetical protein GCM10007886_05540 [Methylobacterium gregans]|nr:hypothetical protein GCM10007886_05540 [Methylobacterium gregans]